MTCAVGQIRFKPNFEFGIFRIKSRKVENGRKMRKPFSTFTFEIRNISNAKAKTVKSDKKKYEFDRIKYRKRCGSVRDISVPFLSLILSGSSHNSSRSSSKIIISK